MNKKQYLLKLKGKLIFKLPTASLRELLTETDEFLQEENADVSHYKNFGTYQEFAKEIAPEKNYRCLVAAVSAILAVISHILFWSTYIAFAGVTTEIHLAFFSVTAMIFTGIVLWLLFGIDCYWESYYEYPVKKLLKWQVCVLLVAVVMQLIILFVIPYIFLAGYKWNEPLYWSIVVIFLLFGAFSFIRLLMGHYQSYFSFVQFMGILYSLATYRYYTACMDDFMFFKHPFIMVPYIACLITDMILFGRLIREVGNGHSN